MTIHIFPSRLPGEPLETHKHGAMTLQQWLTDNVRGYEKARQQHPIAVEVDGVPIAPDGWPHYLLHPASEVRIYPIPYGPAAPAWAVWTAVAVSVASAAYSIYMMATMDKGGLSGLGQGDRISLDPARANAARLGDPIREVFGRYRVFPDYVVQPISRFSHERDMITSMFLCVGVGNFDIKRADIRIGATPVSSFGDDVSYTIYPPGADVSADPRAENWYNSTEVGNTSSGSAGLDLGTSGPAAVSVNADAVVLAGNTVTLLGSSAEASDTEIPSGWVEGTLIDIDAPDTYSVTTVDGYSEIAGSVAELVPAVGMLLTLKIENDFFSLVIADWTPEVAAVPGGGGAKPASLRLAYPGGEKFAGLPEGNQRFSLLPVGYRYQITAIDTLTMSVARVTVSHDAAGHPVTTRDSRWSGFVSRTLLDASVTGVNDSYDWVGPFLSCPEGETTDRLEVNLNFPNGLVRYNSKGKRRSADAGIILQYRAAGSRESWQERGLYYQRQTEDQIGFTEAVDVPRGQYEVRMRRTASPAGGSTRDQVFWQALRARLATRPARYDGVTTLALTIRTGSRLAAQSDRRVSVTAPRIYDNGFPARSISGALWHVLHSLGIETDGEAIAALEAAWWTPRGETFDYVANDPGRSALDILQTICNAGMSYFLLSDGLASVGREGIKSWAGILSPQETTDEMQTAFTAPTEDDYDAVDVTYIDGLTWAEETVQCRVGNDTPRKVENYKLYGVVDTERAWRIGMRRLMKYRYQRLTHAISTELDALCYQFGDRLVLADDIPGSDTISCFVTDMQRDGTKVTLSVSEPLDWHFANPRCVIRFQDGSASVLLTPQRVDDYTLTLPETRELRLDEWTLDSPHIEPPGLIFCSSQRVGYDAIISSIEPSADGTCQLSAAQYSPLFYQFDDASYPGDAA
ncbi:host specificity factor TipJ family phage tail protein [Pseudescherichia sp.]|uniref:host specificity factor TipJ family phage tail protein n=1 Tax=Pseudescherichia sp. TaxID=2055881 RepID=UPI0028A0E7AD|nr:host specificity factor TipJ family phage tail protein [Pseudescherichia sp.]